MSIKTSVLAFAIATAMTGAFALATPICAHADEPVPAPTTDATAVVTAPAPSATPDATVVTTPASDDATAVATKAAAKDSQPALAEASSPAPAGAVSKATVIAKLKAAGYSDINDLKFENAVWHAGAKDSKGRLASLTLAASDGHIILSQHE